MKIMGLAVAMGVLISGCASVSVTPPDDYERDRSRTYDMSYEKTWSRAVDWFADHDVTIEKIEKPSGLLTAKYRLKADDKLLDCGDIQVSGTMGEERINRSGSLNVTVRERSPKSTMVNVNFFGEFKLVAIDAWDARQVTAQGDCVSTGELERKVLDFIGRG